MTRECGGVLRLQIREENVSKEEARAGRLSLLVHCSCTQFVDYSRCIINQVWRRITFANQLSDENIAFYATPGSESNRELLISARRRHGGPTVIARKQCNAGDEDVSSAEMRTPGPP